MITLAMNIYLCKNWKKKTSAHVSTVFGGVAEIDMRSILNVFNALKKSLNGCRDKSKHIVSRMVNMVYPSITSCCHVSYLYWMYISYLCSICGKSRLYRNAIPELDLLENPVVSLPALRTQTMNNDMIPTGLCIVEVALFG